MEEQINENNKKIGPKERAGDSLLLGIVSIIFLMISGYFYLPWNPLLNLLNHLPLDLRSIISSVSLLSPVAAMVGLILGIEGLKSTRKKVAIAGIMFCSLSFLLFLFSLLYMFIFAWGSTQ